MTSHLPDAAVTAAQEAITRVITTVFRDDPEAWQVRMLAVAAVAAALPALTRAITAQATDPVYRERDQLVAALSKLFPAHFANHDDADWEDEWRNIVCIHLPTGQVTWHIHVSEVPLFGHLTIGSNHWDGHDTPEKYRRLNELPPALLGGTADGAHTPGGTT